jgi:restriction endonuclease S subunit
LEGLEITEIKFSKLVFENHSFRLDSEYLQKEFLQNIILIKNFKKGFNNLEHYILNMTGGATPLGAEYPEYGIIFLRVQNIMQNYFNLNDVVYISKEQNDEIKRSQLIEKDVLLTITGSYGKSAVVNKELAGANINQHSVKITLNDELNPYFLSTFLNSKFGKLQSDKNIVGITRPALDYQAIKKFIIPNLSNTFQNKIEEIIIISERVKKISQSLYAAAEQTLLEILGLANWQPTEENTSIKTFSNSFGTSGRLDAEYYQPKYDEIEEKIKMYAGGFELFSAIINSQDKNYNPIEDVEYKYIELSDIGNSGEVTSATVDLGKNLPTRARRIVKTGDVIISSIEGSLSKCALITEEYNNSLCSTGFYVINSTGILPEVLILLFKSFPYQELLKGRCNGTILTAISQEELKTIPIPILPMDKQKELSAQIQESFKNRQESSRLIEIAKQAVEMAIEQDEQTAMKFIKDNT